MKKRTIPIALTTLIVFAFLILLACGGEEETAGSTQQETTGRLELIRERGEVIVGVNAELPGFGYLSPGGEFEGFDVDFGRAIAAAIFGLSLIHI